jgi:putative ABC transport system substrate-binding protein
MRRREFLGWLTGGVIALPFAAGAQGLKVFRVGVFSAGGEPIPEVWAIFVEALRELGWIEGKTIIFERRLAYNRLDRVPDMANELVGLNVDLIVTIGSLAPLAAKKATSTIPILMTAAGDPLGMGLVANLARPGGNMTGFSLMAADIGGKRLELLAETLPGLSRVAVLWNATNPYATAVFKQTQAAGQTLGIEIQPLGVRGPDDFPAALEDGLRSSALIVVEDPLTADYRGQIADFATRHRLPSIYGVREFVEVGGLMSYGTDLSDLYRRAARYVDKILRGAKPGDLPVEQPTKFDLFINLKAAKTIGVQIPVTMLTRANEVLE